MLNSPRAYGIGAPTIGLAPIPIPLNRNPATSDIDFPIGQLVVNEATNTIWGLTSKSAGLANWAALGSGTTGAVTTLTGGSGGALSPTLGNINILGTASQITSTGAVSTITLSIPAAFIAPGSIAATTSVSSTTTMTAGTDLATTAGNLLINGSAKQLRVKGGAATDFIGQTTLVAGTKTIANTNIAAGDKIMVSRHGINGSTALGVFDVAITPATSFSITARNPADATTQVNDISIVDYVIIRQI